MIGVTIKLPKDYEDLKSFQPCTSPSPTATEGEGGGGGGGELDENRIVSPFLPFGFPQCPLPTAAWDDEVIIVLTDSKWILSSV